MPSDLRKFIVQHMTEYDATVEEAAIAAAKNGYPRHEAFAIVDEYRGHM